MKLSSIFLSVLCLILIISIHPHLPLATATATSSYVTNVRNVSATEEMTLSNLKEEAEELITLGKSQDSKQDTEAAIATDEKALTLSSDICSNYSDWGNLGDLLYKLRRDDEATTHFQKALKQAIPSPYIASFAAI